MRYLAADSHVYNKFRVPAIKELYFYESFNSPTRLLSGDAQYFFRSSTIWIANSGFSVNIYISLIKEKTLVPADKEVIKKFLLFLIHFINSLIETSLILSFSNANKYVLMSSIERRPRNIITECSDEIPMLFNVAL